MKVGLLTHSVNPRGGVVHTLELADALAGLGHEVTAMAPARPGQAFFRPTRCRISLATLSQAPRGVVAMVESRIEAYLAHLRSHLEHERYDVLHAQDSISGNALATLAQEGRIDGYTRTVHHLDEFAEPRLSAWQERAFLHADAVFCVSATWVEHLRLRYGVHAARVSNGVNRRVYHPGPASRDAAVAQRYGISREAPVFLVVGGIEPRKNTLSILEAFVRLRAVLPTAQLVVAGGASLLDHGAYCARFHDRLAQLDQADRVPAAVVLTGTVPDDDMPSLYRLADVLVMASRMEGFGLAVLEALASGIAVVASRQPPFTEYLTSADCTFTDCDSVDSIARSMAAALASRPRPEPLLQRFSWRASALRHAELYGRGRDHGAPASFSISTEDALHARHAFPRPLA